MACKGCTVEEQAAGPPKLDGEAGLDQNRTAEAGIVQEEVHRSSAAAISRYAAWAINNSEYVCMHVWTVWTNTPAYLSTRNPCGVDDSLKVWMDARMYGIERTKNNQWIDVLPALCI